MRIEHLNRRIWGRLGDGHFPATETKIHPSAFIIHPCSSAGLVIEDGDVHDLQKEEDERREKVLSEMGLRIVRFGNGEVIRKLSAVVGKIRKFVEK